MVGTDLCISVLKSKCFGTRQLFPVSEPPTQRPQESTKTPTIVVVLKHGLVEGQWS